MATLPQSNNLEHRMKTAQLGKETRKYLASIGRFNDAMNELWDIVDVEYSHNISDVMNPMAIQFDLLQVEIYKLLALHISTGMACLERDEI